MENTANYLNKTKPTIKTYVTGDATHNQNLFLEELLRKGKLYSPETELNNRYSYIDIICVGSDA